MAEARIDLPVQLLGDLHQVRIAGGQGDRVMQSRVGRAGLGGRRGVFIVERTAAQLCHELVRPPVCGGSGDAVLDDRAGVEQITAGPPAVAEPHPRRHRPGRPRHGR